MTTNEQWEAFAKDAAKWVDTAGAGLLELMRRHGLGEPDGTTVSDHYPFVVLEGVVAGFELAGFVLDEVAEYDVPATFGPVVNVFGARAAVDADNGPASGPIVNRHGAQTAAGDAPAAYNMDDVRRMQDSRWSVREMFARAPYDAGGWLPAGRTPIPDAELATDQADVLLDALHPRAHPHFPAVAATLEALRGSGVLP